MFGFGKKKQESMPDLPPPPSPPGMSKPTGDLPPIRSKEEPSELPELPPAPDVNPFEGVDLPEAPTPEMPEAPAPKPEEMAAPEELHETGHEEPQVPEFAMDEMPRTVEPLTPIEESHEPAFEPRLDRETVRPRAGPAFVSVDEYRTIMSHSDRVRAKLSEAEEFMQRLNEIKNEEEKAFDKWRGQLEDVERKLGQIDRLIAKAKR